MDKKVCDEVEKTLKELYDGLFYVANYEYYLWVFENEGERKVIVIHGHGTDTEPFEVKLLSIDEKKTVDKRFKKESDLLDYLRNDLIDDMMVYGI